MAEFNLRADTVDVEQIMRQIRARIREKRGVDYTEEQIQELAKIRLEKFLDPKGVRSDLLDQFRQTAQLDIPPTYEFDDQTLIRSGNPLIAFFRRLLQPILKLFFSPNPLVHALHVQTQINKYLLERAQRDVLVYEVMHNLVVEMTRTGIEVKNMQMRVESVASRLDFNERRARALEAVVQYRSDAVSERPAMRDGRQAKQGDSGRQSWQGDQNRPADQGRQGDQAPRNGGTEGPSAVDPITGGESLRSRRRRRRRGRRSGPGFQGTTTDERRVTSDELEQGAGSDERTTTSDEQATATTSDERRASATSYERSTPSDEQPAAARGEHDSHHDSGSQDPE
jgi:hypothetical protein